GGRGDLGPAGRIRVAAPPGTPGCKPTPRLHDQPQSGAVATRPPCASPRNPLDIKRTGTKKQETRWGNKGIITCRRQAPRSGPDLAPGRGSRDVAPDRVAAVGGRTRMVPPEKCASFCVST